MVFTDDLQHTLLQSVCSGTVWYFLQFKMLRVSAADTKDSVLVEFIFDPSTIQGSQYLSIKKFSCLQVHKDTIITIIILYKCGMKSLALSTCLILGMLFKAKNKLL